MAIVGDESTLNPYTYVTGFPGWNLLMLQYDALMHVNAEGVPQPWLASAVDVSEDGTVYTITLRDGITWNDGTPMTSADVVFTVEYFKANTQSRFTRALRSVESATAPSPTQVVFTLAAPNPSLPLRTLADVPIIPKHVWEAVANPAEHTFDSVTNVGTGPFRIVEYLPDQFYRLEANPDYFRGAPAVREIVLVKFADDAGTVAALRAGEVDMIVRPIPPEQKAILEGTGEITVIQGPQFTTTMLNWDVTKPPFDRLEVRQAVALAIDRQDLVDTVYLGNATLGNNGWTHPSSPAFNDAVTTKTDVAAANALLDGIGALDGDGDGIRELDGAPLSVELLTPSADSLRLRVAELISEMLRGVGIEVKVAAVEQATWEAKVWPDFDVAKGRDYQLAMWGWSAPVQADTGQISQLVHSDPAVGSINLTGFSDPEADQLAEELGITDDAARRTEILDRLQVIIAEQLPFLMLLYPDGAYAFRPAVYDGWTFITGQGVVDKTSLLPADARP
ncbi:MAG TPA: ABC transporter substrate-binding protein [Patescibacteria group bacterium]|nr:ABC transporter substrate-binding protein [Patescibacteria group bacterium]